MMEPAVVPARDAVEGGAILDCVIVPLAISVLVIEPGTILDP